MFKNLVTLLFLVASPFSTTLSCGQTAAPDSASARHGQNWKLIWADEFDGKAVDRTKWELQTGQHGWGNAEWQNYTDGDNVDVSNGTLKITARKIGEGQKAGDYTSSRLKSKESFRYGRMEIRAKMPTHKGNGLWPAIWMLGDSIRESGWPECGEIDILEYVSYRPDVVHSAIHCQARNHRDGTEIAKHIPLESAEEKFHVYGLEWKQDGLSFYIDDPANVTMTYERPKEYDNNNWPWDKPHHFLMNVAVGGTWGGAKGVEDEKIFPATMEVDYVRVFQQKSD